MVTPILPGLFVTGTDTGVGKTLIAQGLLRALNSQGCTAQGMKPVATGAQWTVDGWRNDDAEALLAASHTPAPYARVNPYAFAQPVAPRLAAARAGVRIDFAHIQNCCHQLAHMADCVVIEGVGGWETPLNEEEGVAALAQRLGLGVIVVVGLRLGCLNHAVLTLRAIRASSLPIVGWVANTVDAHMEDVEGNLTALDHLLDAPRIASLPFQPDPAARQAEVVRQLNAAPSWIFPDWYNRAP